MFLQKRPKLDSSPGHFIVSVNIFKAWGFAPCGAAVGGLATGAGYEINAHSEMNKLDDDYKAERISRAEYQARKSQIEKGSIIY